MFIFSLFCHFNVASWRRNTACIISRTWA